MESDWEDIRRLAADLKRVQLTDTAQRLSERCVVELVGRLLKERRLMLIHSRDGKDILTLDQLEREIIDEVHAHGGRANLPDLQQLLNVDVCHIEAKAVDMCRSDKELTLILGQILHSSYLDRIGEDVNDRLQEAGFVNVSELCKVYDLPTDFLTEVLRERLGSLVSGRGDALDLGVVYTDAFVSRHRARIRGLFTAITRSPSGAPPLPAPRPNKNTDRQKSATPEFKVQSLFIRYSPVSHSALETPPTTTTTTTRPRAAVGTRPPPSYPPLAEVKDVLAKKFPEFDRDAIDELARELSRPLSQAYTAALQSALLVATQGEPGGAGSQRRQGRRDLQEELSASVANIRLFLRGALLFPDDVQPNLSRHLLKTLCADVGNSVFASLASDATSASSPEAAGPITAEGRLKILGKVPEDLRRPLVKLHAMMGGKSVEEFLSSLEEAAEACDLMIKKVDRKRERQLLFQHRQALLGQLGTCEDPALVLHLTATLLFQQARQAALHAPGRSVPSIVAHLHGVIPPDHHALLLRFQSLVVKLLIGQGKGAESAAAASSSAARSNQDAALGHAPEGDQSEKATAEELRSLIPSLKELVTKPRKTSGSEA
ncbi:E3 UFM1-protein ligase 1 [Lampetra fluviatilis]